jgi:hypothetical protein
LKEACVISSYLVRSLYAPKQKCRFFLVKLHSVGLIGWYEIELFIHVCLHRLFWLACGIAWLLKGRKESAQGREFLRVQLSPSWLILYAAGYALASFCGFIKKASWNLLLVRATALPGVRWVQQKFFDCTTIQQILELN